MSLIYLLIYIIIILIIIIIILSIKLYNINIICNTLEEDYNRWKQEFINTKKELDYLKNKT